MVVKAICELDGVSPTIVNNLSVSCVMFSLRFFVGDDPFPAHEYSAHSCQIFVYNKAPPP